MEGIDFIVWVRMSLGEMGLSINWLSEKTGYSRETLSRVLNGKIKASLKLKKTVIDIINDERTKRFLSKDG
ncbi:MAG TPA: hypothetical protein ENL19_02150 [candidate division WOR-3 bacterium]|uniref:XRE family transcriptional regulator n=1 Tax=candidate division WOR-3 bacterium TaxID=2052148 RepID=A0A7C5DAZ2_UNCW3|nr:hypothetical protein [candidate division WOR-3 bacterium]